MIEPWRTFALALPLVPLAAGLPPGTGMAAGLEPLTAVHVLHLGSGARTCVGPGLIAHWSPDGRHRAFSDARSGPEARGYAFWDWREVRRLGSTTSVPVRMAWGRDLLLVEAWRQPDPKEDAAGIIQAPLIVVHDTGAGRMRVLGERARATAKERWALSPDGRKLALTLKETP